MCSPPSRPRHNMLFGKAPEVRDFCTIPICTILVHSLLGVSADAGRCVTYEYVVGCCLLLSALRVSTSSRVPTALLSPEITPIHPRKHDTCGKLTSAAAPGDCCVVTPTLLNPLMLSAKNRGVWFQFLFCFTAYLRSRLLGVGRQHYRVVKPLCLSY